jgi:hypothetical protein
LGEKKKKEKKENVTRNKSWFSEVYDGKHLLVDENSGKYCYHFFTKIQTTAVYSLTRKHV